MVKTAMPLSQDPEYERFLHASVGQDKKGFVVSVLSMLARLGVDPWREAAELAELSEDSARKRLDMLTARFSDVPSLALERGATVIRLIALLPRGASPRASAPRGANPGPSLIVGGTPVYAMILIILLLAQLFFRS
jgi:hypothetical protein